jgi:AraC family transcriptional regulator of adaptative response / DNA-3-methyladenine glycosylase II
VARIAAVQKGFADRAQLLAAELPQPQVNGPLMGYVADFLWPELKPLAPHSVTSGHVNRGVRIRPISRLPARNTRVVDGVNAVVTTGIYCRPGCAGRPRLENIRRFDLAAAAEASGYRACLRCRPYRSSPTVQWSSGPELVCRAVRMIIDGALDEQSETQFARSLGVSARHLRRLFTTHVGATADQIARSSRAHFARRLLDDTDLSVTEIAFASGFGSVRQLNRSCHEIFRASPRELRTRRRRADRLAADGGLPLRLAFDGPLEWDTMLDYFAARAIPGVEHVGSDSYIRTVVIGEDPGVIELSRGGPDHLLLRAHLPHWQGLIHIVQRARRIFSLDAPVKEANDHLRADPTIGQLVRARAGLRVPGTWDPYETAIRAIVGQQITVAGATTIMGRIVGRLGTPVPGIGQLGVTHTFPTAELLAGADLSGLGLTKAREAAIHAFAAAVASGEVVLDSSRPLDELVGSLTGIPGLGPWTAHYIALRLGERDAFPTDDVGLRRGLQKLAPDRTLAGLSPGWSPWRATAAVQLWFADE